VTDAVFGEGVNEELFALLTGGKEALLAKLEFFVKGRAVRAVGGPISLGKSSRLGDHKVVGELARCYWTAISDSNRCYPYFEGGKELL
jgi:hypothetical protein